MKTKWQDKKLKFCPFLITSENEHWWHSKNRCSCVQNNSSAFKKVSKAQNPFNSFYFHKRKCIGNTAHSIPDQNMKKNLSNLFLLYRKWRKKNMKLFKKYQCLYFSSQTQNIYCINCYVHNIKQRELNVKMN